MVVKRSIGWSCEGKRFDVVEGFFNEDGFVGGFFLGLHAFSDEEEGEYGCNHESYAAHDCTNDCTYQRCFGC